VNEAENRSPATWPDLSQIGGLLIGFWLLWTAYRLWSTGPSWLEAGWQWVDVALVALAFGVLLASAMAWTRTLRWLVPLAAVAGLVTYAVYLHLTSFVQPGTDELAYTRYAARLILHGRNPYLISMAPSLARYSVPAAETTPTLTGSVVTSFSYPALGALLLEPARLLGVTDPLWTLIAALGVSLALLAFVLPEPWRYVAPLALLVDRNVVYLALNGLTDILYVPFLIGTVALFRRRPRWSFALFGLACAIKQTPWVFAPFLLLGRAYDADAAGESPLRAVGEAVASGLGAFLLPNLAFMVLSPRSWLYGSLSPLIAHLVIYGQGAASVALTGLVARAPFELLTVGALIAALAAAAALYRKGPALLWILPLGAYFVAARSLANYWGFVEAPAFAAFVLWHPSAMRLPVWVGARRWGATLVAAVAAGGVAVAGLGGLALAVSHPPIRVRIVAAMDPTHTDMLSRLRLTVANLAPLPEAVSYMLVSGAQTQTLWRQVAGPRTLDPGTQANVVIEAATLGAAVPDTPGAAIVVDGLVPTGEQVPSPLFRIHVPLVGVVNPRFRYWVPNDSVLPGVTLPVGWSGQVTPGGLTGVQRTPQGVRLVARTNVGGGWWATSLDQTVRLSFLRTHPLDVEVRVSRGALEPPFWTAFAGLELTGSNGRQVLFVRSAGRRRFLYRTTSLTVVGEPGPVGGWGLLTVGIDKALGDASLRPDLHGDITMRLVVAAQSNGNESMVVRAIGPGK